VQRHRQWFLVLAAWSVPGVISALSAVAFMPAAERGKALLPVFGISLAGWWTWALMTPGILWMQRRYPIERGSVLRVVPAHVVGAAIASLIYVGASLGTALLMFAPARGEPIAILTRSYFTSRLPIGVLLYAAVIGVGTAVAERRQRLQREVQSAQLREELALAQARALQAQLQPHFLFNTLHTIGLLVAEAPADAQRTLLRLGDLLRRTLALSETPSIALRDELAVLQEYLAIETTRFGDRLTVVIDAPEGVRTRRVPSLILQPLVENALRHGIARLVSGGVVRIAAEEVDGRLLLLVEDNGPGIAAESALAAGHGLTATRRRLAVLYGQSAVLELSRRTGGGTRVSIQLPLSDA
jgi:two-component sensor histidine kinase